MKIRAFIYIVIICFLVNCGDKSTNGDPPEASGRIVPLTVGNMWVYERTVGLPDIDTVQIVGDTLIDNSRWYLRYYSNSGTFPARNTESGYESYGIGLIYKYPANVGDQYIRGNRAVRVDSINTLLTTPLGSFECYKYYSERSGYDGSETEYVAVDIGLIRVETRVGDNLYVRELIDRNF